MTNLIFYVVQEGRTPLHYAAALQGTTGGHNQLYSALVDAGASEDVVDVVGQRLSFQILFHSNCKTLITYLQ